MTATDNNPRDNSMPHVVSPEMGNAINNMILALEAIQAKHPKKRPYVGVAGKMDCPACKAPDALHYSISSVNGHIHAACKTKDCVRFMQ